MPVGQNVTMVTAQRTVGRTSLGVIVLALIALTVLSLAWLGSTGEVPWGYRAADHWPIWRQYLLLGCGALVAVGVVVTACASANSAMIGPRAARIVGVCLTVIVLLWAAALLLFALWGGVEPRAVALPLASIAPAATPALALLMRGMSAGRSTTILASLGALGSGAAATLLTFSSSWA